MHFIQLNFWLNEAKSKNKSKVGVNLRSENQAFWHPRSNFIRAERNWKSWELIFWKEIDLFPKFYLVEVDENVDSRGECQCRVTCLDDISDKVVVVVLHIFHNIRHLLSPGRFELQRSINDHLKGLGEWKVLSIIMIIQSYLEKPKEIWYKNY